MSLAFYNRPYQRHAKMQCFNANRAGKCGKLHPRVCVSAFLSSHKKSSKDIPKNKIWKDFLSTFLALKREIAAVDSSGLQA